MQNESEAIRLMEKQRLNPPEEESDDSYTECESCGEMVHEDNDLWEGQVRCLDCRHYCIECGDNPVLEELDICESCAMA